MEVEEVQKLVCSDRVREVAHWVGGGNDDGVSRL